MRLTLTVDNLSFQIDSTDPELIGRWVVEIFARTGPFTPATYCTMQAYPSYVRDPATGRERPDWIADSRVIGRIHLVRTPQEVVDMLQKQVSDLESLNA